MNDRRPLRPPATEDLLGWKRRRAVRNYAPSQLLGTGVRWAVRRAAGLHQDRRDLVGQPLSSYAHPEHRYADAGDGLWVDFVADVGDGFEATYAVARVLAAPELRLGAEVTERGRLLIFGGDLVYPSPTSQRYRERLIGPYRAALPVEDPVASPDALALPGDHDWLDGLASFRAVIGQRGWLGGWRLRQSRSYFDVALPFRYWLWGVDTLLGVDVEPQRQYFRDAADKLRPDDRVILCTHRPLWDGAAADEAQLRLLEELVVERGAIVALHLAGHRHRYAHYRAGENGQGSGETRARHYVTAGGGGTFTEDTSRLPPKLAPRERLGSEPLLLKNAWPDPGTARKLGASALLRLPWLATEVALATGVLWLIALLAGDVPNRLGSLPSAHSLEQVLAAGAAAVRASWVLKVLLGVLGLSAVAIDVLGELATRNDRQQRTSGSMRRMAAVGAGALMRAMAQAAATLGACWALSQLVPWPAAGRLAQVAWSCALVAATGLSTVFVIALYLLAASRVSDQHADALFAVLGDEDYKNFVRLHIAKGGRLTVYPVGVRRTPRRWRLRPDAPDGAPWFEPAAGGAFVPAAAAALIHDPIVIEPGPAQAAAVANPTAAARDEPYDVFVSYTRADAGWTRGLVQALKQAAKEAGLGDLKVFVDTEALKLDEYWRRRIIREIDACHSFVAIYSPDYQTACAAEGMCLEEYEAARSRQHRDPGLVFHVLTAKVNLPGDVAARNLVDLQGTRPDAIANAERFPAFCAELCARVKVRRVRRGG